MLGLSLPYPIMTLTLNTLGSTRWTALGERHKMSLEVKQENTDGDIFRTVVNTDTGIIRLEWTAEQEAAQFIELPIEVLQESHIIEIIAEAANEEEGRWDVPVVQAPEVISLNEHQAAIGGKLVA